MAFWGIEVKPGESYAHRPDEARGRLHVTKATLGDPAVELSNSKATVRCSIGEKSPVSICKLVSGQCEMCPMKLEFEEKEEVIFSVLGQTSVHLTGYYVGSGSRDGEPIAELAPPCHPKGAGDVNEEVLKEGKSSNEDQNRLAKKRNHSADQLSVVPASKKPKIYESLPEVDEKIGEDVAQGNAPKDGENGFVVVNISSGQSDGKMAKLGSKVFVYYSGKLRNGDPIDANIGREPFKFFVGEGCVIKGLEEGVIGMRVGDKNRLNIPPAMGYGDKEVNNIPRNSWLIYEVELVNVE